MDFEFQPRKAKYFDEFHHQKGRGEKKYCWQNFPKLLPGAIENLLALQIHYNIIK